MTTLRRAGVLVIALITLVVAGAATWLRLGVLLDSQRPVAHAYRVLAEVGRLGLLADQADRASRAYLAGQDAADYKLYRDDMTALESTLLSVRALTVGDPVHQRITAEIQTVAGTGDAAPADASDERFGRVIALVAALHDHEATVLDRGLRDGSASTRDARLQIAGILAAGTLLVICFWWGTAPAAGRAASGAAAAGRADVERELRSLPAGRSEEEEVRGALVGAG
jgi:CHASE3 domain sensor protein